MTSQTMERVNAAPSYGPHEFWDALPVLAQIRQHARARLVSPWATLGVVLARVVTTIAPEVVLPPIVGGYASLNLFVALVAPSGMGKGGAEAAGREFCAWHQPLRFSEITIGSGEGIATAYGHTAKHEDGSAAFEQHTDAALFSVPEVDTFLAVAGRSGSTLSSELRKLWSGETLGFNNRSSERSVIVPAHHYRAALLMGVQPERSGALLGDESAGGLPQRILWLSAADPDMPDYAPDSVPALQAWKPPTLPANEHGKQVLNVCHEVRQVVMDNHRARHRGEGDALDGHALLTRLKVAAALNMLAQSPVPGVNSDDWHLAGYVMDESSRVRQSCLDALRGAAHAANMARALARGDAEIETDVRAADVATAKAKERILLHVGAAPIGASAVRKKLSPKLRDYFDAALEELEQEGVVTVAEVEYQGQKGLRITLNASRGDEITTPKNG
ncbi:DUF3987 domain-containing protein [Leucobacter sp. HY1910]